LKIKKPSDWLFILILVFSSLWATKALWHVGLFTSHDGPHQVVRLLYYEQALKDGQFPPRYILSALKGFGYPLFIFSYHLPWIMAMPFRLLGLSIYDCIKIIFIITFVVSGLTMYFWQKKLWGGWGAFVGAFLYLWAPYRFSDIYVRGSLGEAMTFMFIPLVFSGNIIIGSLAIAGIILSHSLIFVLLLPVLIFYKPSWQSLKIFLLGLGLSAFYLIPAVLLKNQTIFTKTITMVAQDFSQHFPSFKQLVYSPWGYGFSFPGPNDGMSFQVGIAQWLAVGLAIFYIFRQRRISLWLIFFIFSILMMQPVSKFVWQIVNKFAFIDYPWRYLFLSVFSASVLAGFVVSPRLIGHGPTRKNILIGVLLVAVALYTNRNHIRVNAWLDWPPETFIASGETSNTFDEYTPAWVNTDYTDKKKDLIQIITGKGSWANTIKKTSTIEFTARNEEPSEYRVNVLYFPDVRILVDGKVTDYSYKTKGVLDFTVPEGQHQVFIGFQGTLLEKIALVVSVISLVIGLFYRRTFAADDYQNS